MEYYCLMMNPYDSECIIKYGDEFYQIKCHGNIYTSVTPFVGTCRLTTNLYPVTLDYWTPYYQETIIDATKDLIYRDILGEL